MNRMYNPTATRHECKLPGPDYSGYYRCRECGEEWNVLDGEGVRYRGNVEGLQQALDELAPSLLESLQEREREIAEVADKVDRRGLGYAVILNRCMCGYWDATIEIESANSDQSADIEIPGGHSPGSMADALRRAANYIDSPAYKDAEDFALYELCNEN